MSQDATHGDIMETQICAEGDHLKLTIFSTESGIATYFTLDLNNPETIGWINAMYDATQKLLASKFMPGI